MPVHGCIGKFAFSSATARRRAAAFPSGLITSNGKSRMKDDELLPPSAMKESSPLEEQIFTEALCLSEEQWAGFLVHACRGDSALRQQVELLLEEHARTGGALDEQSFVDRAGIGRGLRERAPPEDCAGARIGHYHLLQKLGEGGCGVVFLAEQEEPVRRRVALKIIKLGMDTREVVARF